MADVGLKALARFDRETVYGSLAAELDARVEAA
jgi:hypothetical protein